MRAADAAHDAALRAVALAERAEQQAEAARAWRPRRLTVPLTVLFAWREEKEAHAPCRRFHPQGATETLEPEHVWDGWEWLANPDAPSAAVLAGPHIMRPHSHPAEVAQAGGGGGGVGA